MSIWQHSSPDLPVNLTPAVDHMLFVFDYFCVLGADLYRHLIGPFSQLFDLGNRLLVGVAW